MMRHKKKHVKEYAMDLKPILKEILDNLFENKQKLDGALLDKLKEYTSSIPEFDSANFEKMIHKMRITINSTNGGSKFNDPIRQLLDLLLVDAVKSDNRKREEAILKAYFKLYKNDNAFLNPKGKIKNIFDDLENNETINKNLKSAVDNNSLALIIGAGVTAGYVGSWTTLLSKLMTMRVYSSLLKNPKFPSDISMEKLQDYLDEHIYTFIADTVNYLERGEYLRFDSQDTSVLIGTQAENKHRELFFAEQVRQIVLYSLNHAGDNHDEKFEEAFKKDSIIGKKETSLSAIVRLCAVKNIKEIITYNFDTALDRLIADNEIREHYQKKNKVVVNKVKVEIYCYYQSEPVLTLPIDAEDNCQTIKIYHVHGVVDKDIREIHPIIFSENSYQNYQKTILNWSNIHLADIQSRYSVLCVGFSGDDPNFRSLRRFFDDAKRNPVMGKSTEDEQNKRSMFLMRDYSDDKKRLFDPEGLLSDNNYEYAYASIKTYFDMVNSYFKKQYDVDIIWSHGFDHMADQIIELAKQK